MIYLLLYLLVVLNAIDNSQARVPETFASEMALVMGPRHGAATVGWEYPKGSPQLTFKPRLAADYAIRSLTAPKIGTRCL